MGRVAVYWNIRKHIFSVMDHGLVVAHVDHIKLRTVNFVVQPGGRDAVRRTGCKNVHAFVRGEIIPDDSPLILDGRARYNPMRDMTWVTEHDVPLTRAEAAVLTHEGGHPLVYTGTIDTHRLKENT